MKGSRGTLLVLCLAWGYATAQTCYFPNGDEAVDDVPCSSDQHTNCCGKAGICLSNGFCLNALSQPYTISRGTCTDQNWGSNCTQRCIGTNDNPGGGVSVVNLDYVDGKASYCCGTPVSDGDTMVCPNGEISFSVETGSLIVGRAALANLTESNSDDSDSGTASATATGSSPTETLAPEATTSCSASETTTNSTETCDKGTSATAVGAGVGVPLGVIALSAIAWALWERGRRTKERTAVMVPQELGSTPAEPKAMYQYGQANYGQLPQWQSHSPPAELPNGHYPTEMDSSHLRQ